MAFKAFYYPSSYSSSSPSSSSSFPTSTTTSTKSTSKPRLISYLFIFSILLFLLTTIIQPQYPTIIDIRHPQHQPPIPYYEIPSTSPTPTTTTTTSSNTDTSYDQPTWLQHISSHLTINAPMKIGLVNMEDDLIEETLANLKGTKQVVKVEFDKVSSRLKWKDIFPEWIDEEHGSKCPSIPMPDFQKYKGLDVIVATAPCVDETVKVHGEGIRDMNRLQINLMVANLAVYSGRGDEDDHLGVRYVVFADGCEPMWEIFRCDDLVLQDQVGKFWLYEPNLKKLRQKVVMPIGTCELARKSSSVNDFDEKALLPTGLKYIPKEAATIIPSSENRHSKSKQAYVTVLHSSEQYVCGAIALAQSILKTNTTRDLVLLVDNTISAKSIHGLKSTGWKIKRIQRVRSPNAKVDAYNEWNYSKLRVWQLTEYDKVMFIDSDFIVLHNIDHFFAYPQLSAAANDKWLFNSGIMILEPSQCIFDRLMKERFSLKSYNGGDQGYLNEVFTWWHRLTIKINHLKIFKNKNDHQREVPNDRYTIHFLGLKPWLCYKDYDCNWDKSDHWIFASDGAHNKWWEIYDVMPKKLQSYCKLTTKMDARIRKWRGKAKADNFPEKHWKIRVKDPRKYRLKISS